MTPQPNNTNRMNEHLQQYKNTIALPVRYERTDNDGARILDDENNVLFIVPYGPSVGNIYREKRRDAIGNHLADAINREEFWREKE